MNKLIWKLRYAWQVKRRCGWRMFKFGWYCAGEALNDGMCCSVDYDPTDAADDEMSYWGD